MTKCQTCGGGFPEIRVETYSGGRFCDACLFADVGKTEETAAFAAFASRYFVGASGSETEFPTYGA